MTPDIKELIAVGRKYADGVDKDRGFESGLTDCLRGLSDALEAMAGEVERLTSDVDALGENLEKVVAERDRLKAALVKARHELVTHNGLYATDIYPENREQLLQNGVNIEWQIDTSAVLEAIDAALGDAAGDGR